MPPEWFERWWTATAATDEQGGGETIRAPNGVVLDGVEYWSVGRPLYDPGSLQMPVLVVVGEWDNDTPPSLAQTLFPLINRAPWKRMSILGGGTHAMLMERNRILLFRTVSQFLEEVPPGEQIQA
jgi:pimeloyl-ACP methyl ester carboxylesterase